MHNAVEILDTNHLRKIDDVHAIRILQVITSSAASYRNLLDKYINQLYVMEKHIVI